MWRLLPVLAFALTALAEPNRDPIPPAASKKGLQVQMVDDALVLGIKHAAINVDLAQMIDPVGAEGSLACERDGRVFHFRSAVVASYDRVLQPLSEAGVQVTLIVLNVRSADPAVRAIMQPAETPPQGGPIAGFNVDSPEGAAWYRAAIGFLAERYQSAAGGHGRAVGYIIGNEVNSHGAWYDCGDLTMEALAERYERAVRMAHTEIRRFSEQARVYLSFDHHWTSSSSPQNPLRGCSGRALLDEFARRARAGGDFDWHVAYHPYPADLGEPRTWLDKVGADSEAALITPRNLEVLPAYLRRPELLFEGRPRRIILSEQGFHTPERPEGERWQAEGFCYTWAKVQQLDGIDAFILHRHVDHPQEGGLHLGLWTNKPGSIQPDRRKLLYEVFRKCDTPEWSAVAAQYPPE